MKIREVKATIVPISRRRTLKTAYGEMPDTTTVVVVITTDDGLQGVGQTVAPAPWYGETAGAIKMAIDNYLAPALIGEHPFSLEGLHQRMHHALRGANYAVTALDIALWDLKGKALDVPVYELLGGVCNDGAPLHAFVERTTVDETAARVQELHAEGWRWFKTKIGFGPSVDLPWYEALRQQVPEDALFQVDGNTGYTLGEAVQTIAAMEEMGGLALVEQPVRYLDEMAELARRLRTPIQADEALTGPRSVYEIATAKAAHVLHFKLQKYGGLLPAKRMAAVAEAAGLELSVAPYFDILAAAAAHFAVSTPGVRWPAGFSDMQDTILQESYTPQALVLEPPSGAGLGIRVDFDKLAHYEANV